MRRSERGRDRIIMRNGRESACKRFCFTLNNPTEEEIKTVSELQPSEEPEIAVFVCGLEHGEQEGREHFQGYVEVTRRVRFNGLRALLPFLARAAIFVAKGSRVDNFKYCTKENVLNQWGAPEYKQRSDLDELRSDLLDSSISIRDVADKHFGAFLRYQRGISAYLALVRVPRDRRADLKVVVYYGPPGSGKTRRVWEMEEPSSIFVWGGDRWFDGYEGQSVALFDDYRGELPFGRLLQYLDVYPVQVPIKGGFRWFTPTTIYITSNHRPELWYSTSDIGGDPWKPEENPLLRRLTSVELIE